MHLMALMLSDLLHLATSKKLPLLCLNAPYGAPCFLAGGYSKEEAPLHGKVLMHLMALHAF